VTGSPTLPQLGAGGSCLAECAVVGGEVHHAVEHDEERRLAAVRTGLDVLHEFDRRAGRPEQFAACAPSSAAKYRYPSGPGVRNCGFELAEPGFTSSKVVLPALLS